MARKRHDDFADAAPIEPPAPATPAPDAAPLRPAMRAFAVALLNHPTLVLEATSSDAAWDEYRRRNGIIASDHKPSIAQVVGEPLTPAPETKPVQTDPVTVEAAA